MGLGPDLVEERSDARRRRFGIVAAFVLGLCCLAAGAAGAQDLRVQVSRGPHYVGDPIEVQIVASGFESEPQPEIEAAEVAGGRLRYAGVSDSSSTSITIVNGRMNRVTEVSFVYRYELVAARAGRLRIPPFRVRQAATERTTRALDLTIERVPTTGLVELDVSLPKGPIFVGQKIPLTVEFRIDREAQRDLVSYRAEVPLFDLPTLRFLDEPLPDANSQLELETAAGTMRLPAVSREETIGGRRVLVLRAKRTLIALAPEEIRADAPRVLIERGTRFRRDLFNQRQAIASERLLAEGKPVRLEVAEVPREGRPPSFAGAVGEGFSLEVSADRSVVQLGEPILLTFRLRGDGDLSSAGLPPLDAEGLFDPDRFRLPAESPPGLTDDDGKVFEASLRVVDADVREIPALAYSWFDAGTRRFETTYSRPIALSVGAAEIIGADDVTSRTLDEEASPAGTERPAAGGEAPSSEPPVRETSFARSGASLAVERDADRVLRGGRTAPGGVAGVVALYLVGIGLLAFAALDRRRMAADPVARARKRAFSQARQAVEAALVASGADAAAGVGRALRELVATLPDLANDEFDDLLAECDAIRFRPSGTDASLPESLVERTRRFVADRSEDVE